MSSIRRADSKHLDTDSMYTDDYQLQKLDMSQISDKNSTAAPSNHGNNNQFTQKIHEPAYVAQPKIDKDNRVKTRLEYDEILEKISESRKCIQRIGNTFYKDQDQVIQIDNTVFYQNILPQNDGEQNQGGIQNAQDQTTGVKADTTFAQQTAEQNQGTYTQREIIKFQREEIEQLRQKLKNYELNTNYVRDNLVPSARALQTQLNDKDVLLQKADLKLNQYQIQLKLREQQIFSMQAQIKKLQEARSAKSQKPVTSLNLVVFQEALQPLCKTHLQSSDIKKNKDLVVQNLQILFRKETDYLQSELKIMREQLESAIKNEQVVKNYDKDFELEVERAVNAVSVEYNREIARLKAEIFELNELIRTKDTQLQAAEERLIRAESLTAASSEVKSLQQRRIDEQAKEIDNWKRAATMKNYQTRKVLTDYQHEINERLNEMKRQNMKIRLEHEELMGEARLKAADRSQIRGKVDQIFNQLQELKGYMGSSIKTQSE